RLRPARVAALLGTAAVVLAVVLIFAFGRGGHGSGARGASAARHHAGRSLSHPTGMGGHPFSASAPSRRVGLLSLPAQPVPRTVRVPILTWHRVAVFANEYTKSIPDETVEPSVFAAEIDALAAHGFHPVSQLQ